MDVEAYMHAVRNRLGAAAARRNEIRSATLGPLGPIQERIATKSENLRTLREDLRSQKKAALDALTDQAQQRRAAASEEAARLIEEADRRAKELRRSVKEQNEVERAELAREYDERLVTKTRDLENELSELRTQEASALSELDDDLADADGDYRAEYEKVVGERIITRKALENMGFEAPPTKRKQPASDKKVNAR